MGVIDGISAVTHVDTINGTINTDYQPTAGDTWSISLISSFCTAINADTDKITVGLWDAAQFSQFFYVLPPVINTVDLAVDPGTANGIQGKLVTTNTNYARIAVFAGGVGGDYELLISGIKIVE